MMMKNRRQICSWIDLPVELLQFIVLMLSVPDVARFKLVCSSWYNAAKIYPKGPFLMIPSSQETSDQILQFFSAEDETKVVYSASNHIGRKLLDDGICVGSSHGWLIVIDKFANPCLLNLFSGKDIFLPVRETFPHIAGIKRLGANYVSVMYKPDHMMYPNYHNELTVHDFKRTLIQKAIISANPSHDKNYKVAIIYSYRSKLAFCCHGDYKWTALCNVSNYQDLVWQGDMLYAIVGEGDCVLAWDFKDSVPERKIIVGTSYLHNIDVGIRFDVVQYYLTLSMGDILVIHRYIGDMVNKYGEVVVGEADLFSDENNHPLICPYRTLKFKVFKLDRIQETWTEVKSLEDKAIFVGGNQTFSLCNKDFVRLKRDSIYFSDNYWERMDEDYTYGGHDIGIFSLERDSIDMLCDQERIEPTPFWLSTI